jgi:hypothetical protein
MLFQGEKIAVYSENHKLINTVFGRNAEFPRVTADGIYNYHCSLSL